MPSRSGIVAGRAFVILEAIDNTPRVLRRVQANFFRMGAQLQQMGSTLITRSLLALAPSALSTKIFSDFDDSMKKVEARSQGTATEMQRVREQAKLLGRTTAFTARQVGELQAILAQRGFTRSQIFNATPNVLNLARAAGTGNRGQDILVSADLVSGALRAFKMDASESARVADMMTSAVNNSNFSLEDLVISMANAGSIAKIFNNDLSRTLATLAAMRDVNLDPSIAGTGLRNIFLKASDAKGREKFNTQLQELTGSTIQFVDAAKNLQDPADILFSIFDAAKNLGTAQRGRLFADLFGLRAIVPATALAQSKQRFTTLITGFRDAAGLAKQTMDFMESGIGGDFRRLFSAVEGAAIAIGEGLSDSVEMGSRAITKGTLALTAWIEKNHEAVKTVNAVLIVTLGLGAALVVLGTALRTIAFIMSPFITLMSSGIFILKTVGVIIGTLVSAAISILGAALTGIITIISAVIAKLAGLIVVGALVGGVITPLIIVLGLVIGSVAALIGVLAKASIALGSMFVDSILKTKEALIGGLGAALNFLQVILANTIAIFGGIVEAVKAGDLELAWNLVVNGMKHAWLGLKDLILDTLDQLGMKFQELILKAELLINKARQGINPFGDNTALINRSGAIERELLLLKKFGLSPESSRANTNRERDIRETKDVIADLLDQVNNLEKTPVNERIKESFNQIMGSALEGVNTTVKDLVNQGPASGVPITTAPDALVGLQKGTLEAAKQFYQNQRNQSTNRDTLDQQKVNLLGDIEENTRSNGEAVEGV